MSEPNQELCIIRAEDLHPMICQTSSRPVHVAALASLDNSRPVKVAVRLKRPRFGPEKNSMRCPRQRKPEMG